MKDDPGTGRPTTQPRGDRAARPRLSSGAEFAGLGLQFAGAMGLFGLLGWWLDGRRAVNVCMARKRMRRPGEMPPPW